MKTVVGMKTSASIISSLKQKRTKLLMFLMMMFTGVMFGQYSLNFEGSTATALTTNNYSSPASVTLSGITWSRSEILLGNLANDWKNGANSARFRNRNGSNMTMTQNKTSGIGTISFSYRRYGSDSGQQEYRVDYSDDNGANWNLVGTFTPSNASVSVFSEDVEVSGNVRIRIIANTTPGTGGDRRWNLDDLLITDYTSVSPTLTLSTSPTTDPVSVSGLGYVFGGTSTPKDVTVTGNNLTPLVGQEYVDAILKSYQDSTIENFEFSIDGGTTYTNWEWIYLSGNTVSGTIKARLKSGLAIGSYSDKIIVTYNDQASPFYIEQEILLSGEVTAPPTPTISFGSFTTTALTYPFGAGPSASKNATISGSNLTGPITVTTDDTSKWEVSTNNSTWAASVSYTPSGGIVSTTNRIYVRLKAGLAVNTYSGTLTASAAGATNLTSSLTGAVLQSNVTLTAAPTLFSYAQGQGPSTHQTFVVSGTNLADNIEIIAPTNWEISTTAVFTTPLSSITLNKNASNAVANSNIHIRLKSGLTQGLYSGTLEVVSLNAVTQTINVNGEVTGPVAFINVEANIGSFPDIANGTNTPTSLQNTLFAARAIGSSETKSFRIQNLGGAILYLSSLTLSGSDAGDFSISLPPPATIAAGETVTFEVSFSPIAIGERNAIINIPNTSSNASPFSFNVQGTGTNPEIGITGNGNNIPNGNVTISSLDNTFIGSANANSTNPTTVSKSFVISNSGNVVLNVSNISLTGTEASEFSVSPTTTSIAVGSNATLTVTFAPSSYGEKNAIITIANNDATDNEDSYTFAVQGNALSYVACAQNEIILYQTGFEESTFTTQTDYQQTVFDGPAGQQWKTYYGTPTTTNPSISGSKWIQMRLYNNGNVGYTQTEFDLNNVTKVEFRAKTANAELDLMVSYSIDGGTTFTNPQIYDVTNNPTDFSNPPVLTYSVSPTGEHPNVRIRFTVSGTPPSSGSKTISLDDIIIYGGSNNTKTWNGTTWSGDGLPPTASQKAIIDGHLTLPYTLALNGTLYEALEGCECEVNAGTILTIGSADGETPASLNIQSNLENNGTILVNNNSSLVQYNDEAINIGQAAIQRTTKPIHRYDYTYWSSPVVENPNVFLLGRNPDNLDIPGLSPQTLFDKYYEWDYTSQQWTSILFGNQAMVAGKGYLVRAPQTDNYGTNPTDPESFDTYTANFIGIPNNGVVKHPVAGSSDDDPDPIYNLIGNPYPSAIDAEAFVNFNTNPAGNNVLAGTLYFWTHNSPVEDIAGNGFYTYDTGDYASWNSLGAVAAGTLSIVDALLPLNIPSGNIAAGQAFFVKGISEDTTAEVIFNNNMRIRENNNQFFRPTPTTPVENWQTTGKHRIWLNLKGTTKGFSQTLIGYIQNATNGLDNRYDGEVFGGNQVTFYSVVENKNLVIQGRALPFDPYDEVPLGYKSSLNETLTISIDHLDGLLEGQNIYLEDKTLNLLHDLKTADYSFSTTTGTFNDRFVLKFTDTTLGHDEEQAVANGITVFQNENTISISSTIENMEAITLYDITGKVLFVNKNLNQNKLSINDIVMSHQVLIIKVILADGTVVTRKIVY